MPIELDTVNLKLPSEWSIGVYIGGLGRRRFRRRCRLDLGAEIWEALIKSVAYTFDRNGNRTKQVDSGWQALALGPPSGLKLAVGSPPLRRCRFNVAAELVRCADAPIQYGLVDAVTRDSGVWRAFVKVRLNMKDRDSGFAV